MANVCPECKFENLAKDSVCLMCKAGLPNQSLLTQTHKRLESSEPPSAPSSSLRAEDVDTAKVIGWLCCEPLPALPVVIGSTITVGRSPDCDLVLRSKAVSRKHALIKGLGQDMQLEDLGSANGTYLNGKRSPRAKLVSGDVVAIGPYSIDIKSNDDMASSDDVDMGGTQVIMAITTTSGFLSDGSLAEILQGLEFNEKSGTVKILSGSTRGTLVIQAGRPRWAVLGAYTDEEAIYQMLELTEGRYVYTSAVESGDARIQGTITGMLLEASRRQDMAQGGGA